MGQLTGCGCGCGDESTPTAGQRDWAARLAAVVDHVAPARLVAQQSLPGLPAGPAAAAAERAADRAAPGFSVSLDAAALPAGADALDGRLQLIISPAGAVSEPRLHVSSDRCETLRPPPSFCLSGAQLLRGHACGPLPHGPPHCPMTARCCPQTSRRYRSLART